MSDPDFEPRLGRRYETQNRTPTWPFVVGAFLVVAVGAMVLTNQAYQPPYLETTTAQAVQASIAKILMWVVPLVIVVLAALCVGLWFVLGRKPGTLRKAPAFAAALIAAAVLGISTIVLQAHLEKAEYERSGRPAAMALLERTADSYENEVLMSHRVLANRMYSIAVRETNRWFYSRSDGRMNYDRMRRDLDEAREVVANHEAHILLQQQEALERIGRASISRFGKAEAQQDLRERFAASRALRARHAELATAILDEQDAMIDLLQQANPEGRLTGSSGLQTPQFRAAWNAHADRINELSRESRDVVDELVAEGQRVREDAYDRAVARRQMEQDAEAAAAPQAGEGEQYRIM